MSERVSFSKLNLNLQEIAEHHSDIENALKDYYSFSGGVGLSSQSKFRGYTQQELLTEFKKRIEELERTSSLSLLSSLEASLIIDYLSRCYGKKKDPLSRDLRELHNSKAQRASLEQDILTIWKKHHPDFQPLISELIGAFKYRHWLAHGRYWKPKLGRKYDYQYTYSLAIQLYSSLPLMD